MSNPLVASSAQALGFSTAGGDDLAGSRRQARSLNSYTAREWAKHIGVLDRAGLTLPLYAHLMARKQVAQLPRETVDKLEKRRSDNARRMQAMMGRFGEAVDALKRARVQFACVKGFSLIPEFLPEPWERHQIDFDFLIRPGEEARAQLALEGGGYKLTAIEGSERRLRVPVTKALRHNAYLYDLQKEPAIELHSVFWEGGTIELPLHRLEEAFEHTEMHALGSVSFPRLAPHHAFLYQVLHVFRHFLGSWARPLWLYEIASYMNRFGNDRARWLSVRPLIASDPRMMDAVALVLLTAQEIFRCPIPIELNEICAHADRSAIGLWVRCHSRDWLLTDMPGNKLNLLLHRHFIGQDCTWRRHLANRLAPCGKRPRLCEGLDPVVAQSFGYRIADFCFRAGRISYHLRAGAGLAFAGARWSFALRAHRAALTRGGSRTGNLQRSES
jgi:hypothetical protein